MHPSRSEQTPRAKSASAPQFMYSDRFPVWILLFPDAFLGVAAVSPPEMSPHSQTTQVHGHQAPLLQRPLGPEEALPGASTPFLTRRGEEPEATQDLEDSVWDGLSPGDG